MGRWPRCAVAALLGASMISGWALAAPAAKPDDASEQSARLFVQRFYDWYLQRVLAASEQQQKSPKAKDFGFIDGVRQRPTWFSAELRRLLEEDMVAARRCSSEQVGIDWDPFLETQDPSPAYTASKVERTPQGFRVSVDFHDKQTGVVETPMAQADISFVDRHWIFVDFVQSPRDRKFRQGLVQTLKGYERDGEYNCPKD